MAAVAISAASGTWERAKEANLEKQGSRNFAWFQPCFSHVGQQRLGKLISPSMWQRWVLFKWNPLLYCTIIQ